MKNEKHYTATDFESYHAGTMPVNDMYALEKAALEDLFISDALDGYAQTYTATNDIEKIKVRLKLKNNLSTPVKSIINKSWFKIAASIVSIIGLSYLFYTVNIKDDKNTLAKNEQAKNINIDSDFSKQEKDSLQMLDIAIGDNSNLTTAPIIKKDVEIKQDKTTSNNNIATYNTTKETPFTNAEIQQSAAAISPSQAKAEETVVEKIDNLESTNTTLAKDYKADKKNEAVTQNQQLQNYYNYTGTVKTRSGGPMQNATINYNNTATQTDKNGRFNFKATDSNVNASIAANGFTGQNVLLNTNSSPVFKLDFDNKNLDEVAVTNYDKAKARRSEVANSAAVSKEKLSGEKEISLNDALSGKVAGLQVNNKKDAIKPNSIALRKNIINEKTELINFNIYITKNIKPAIDDNGNKIKGKVILSFNVNKEGKASNVKVIQSVNTSCDKQAITLLENAPKWNFKNGDIRTVDINF